MSTKSFTVPALSSSWLDTGLYVQAGKTATINVTGGDATCHAGGAVDCPLGNPSGVGYTCENNPVVGAVPPGPAGPLVPYGALAGRVGASGAGFLVGSSRTASGPGELSLIFNDCEPPLGYSDNAGSFSVAVAGEFGAPPALGAVQEVKALRGGGTHAYKRHGRTGSLERLHVGDALREGDIVTTGPDTVLAFELTAGGRVGVNVGSTVELLNPREVTDPNAPAFRLSKGGMWAKCGDLKEPLEIQTNGGVMGIKG